MQRTYLLIALLMITGLEINAQKYPKLTIDFETYLQELVAANQDETEIESVAETLLQLYQSPLNINYATVDEFRNLYLLKESQILEIISYRDKNGIFLSIYELQAVPTLDLETIRKISPFIKIENKIQIKQIPDLFKKATEHFLLFRIDRTLQESKGFKNNAYLGGRNRIYTRYNYSHPNDFNIGFISEKDPGEKNFLDYSTFNIQLKNKGKFKSIMLGDYQLQFGQGLVCAAGFSAGKGSEPIYTVRRSNLGIKPYNSLIENGNFRGMATSYQIGVLEISPWISYTKRDASLQVSEIDSLQDQTFTGIQSSGYHRTKTELNNKDKINETNLGINGLFRFQKLQIGITALNTQFSKAILKKDELYNSYEFTGKNNLVISSNFSYSLQNLNIFSELARSKSGGIGLVSGLLVSLNKQFEWAINVRSYDKNFHSFYASGFSESSRTINEKGIYSGLKYTPKKGLVFSFFYDQFQFPWLKYLVDASSQGNESSFRISYQPTKKQAMYFQHRNETKQKNKPNFDGNTNILIDMKHQIWMYNFEQVLDNNFKFQSRIQINNSKIQNEKASLGWMLYQDFEGQYKRYTWRTRIAYFNTKDYSSRIYAYENDVLYGVSFPAYYGKGLRIYLVNKFSLTNSIDFWIRLATTIKPLEKISGSGLDSIESPQKTDLKFQIRYTIK